MKKRDYSLLDLAAAFLGVSNVNWDGDFADDGYRDVLGRHKLNEPILWQARKPRPGATLIRLPKPLPAAKVSGR